MSEFRDFASTLGLRRRRDLHVTNTTTFARSNDSGAVGFT
jgi:hypothetical protein